METNPFTNIIITQYCKKDRDNIVVYLLILLKDYKYKRFRRTHFYIINLVLKVCAVLHNNW